MPSSATTGGVGPEASMCVTLICTYLSSRTLGVRFSRSCLWRWHPPEPLVCRASSEAEWMYDRPRRCRYPRRRLSVSCRAMYVRRACMTPIASCDGFNRTEWFPKKKKTDRSHFPRMTRARKWLPSIGARDCASYPGLGAGNKCGRTLVQASLQAKVFPGRNGT